MLSGRQEIGRTDPMLLTEHVEGPRVLLLAGRSWQVTWIDWKRQRCYVEPSDRPVKDRWYGTAFTGSGFALTRACRDVLLGADPPVIMTERAVRYLAKTREAATSTVHPGGTVINRDGDDVRWWNWAGYRANAVLTATLSGLTDEKQRFEDEWVRLRPDLTRDMWKAATPTPPTGSACPTSTNAHSAASNSTRPSRLASPRPHLPPAPPTWTAL